jgi:uncharacterized delta-60 repeat protein
LIEVVCLSFVKAEVSIMKRILVLVLLFIVAQVGGVLAAPGTLDTSFANPNISGFDGYAIGALAIQADGKIIIGGDFESVGGQSRRAIARLNTNGTLDTSFVAPSISCCVGAVAIQADGKIIIGGGFTTVGGQPRRGVGRLNVDGTLDTSFSDPNVIGGGAYAIAIQTDGKIIIGGHFVSVGGQPRNHVARLNTDGTLDTSFVDPNVSNLVSALAVQADGKIIIVGGFGSVGGQNRGRVARLNADGTLDTSFANLFPSNEEGIYYVSDIAIQADGKIIIGGFFSSVGGHPRNDVARLNTDGTLDTSFAPNIPDEEDIYFVNAIAIQTDGKIIIGGFFESVGGQPRFSVARLNADGTLDTSFADPNVSGIFVSYIAIQADGKIIISGPFYSVGCLPHSGIARLNNDLNNAGTRTHFEFDGDGRADVSSSDRQMAPGICSFRKTVL